ncbi:MAG: hypothetical protein P4L50_28115 [Anaerolineaceae bacterium]|nr:hypothetical protein [Anaerolineaceae bacterium]
MSRPTTSIRVPVKKSYEMPSICCTCATQAGKHTKRVFLYGTSQSRRYTVRLDVPVCDKYFRESRITLILGILLGLILGTATAYFIFTTAFLASYTLLGRIALALLGELVGLLVGSILADWLNMMRKTEKARDWYVSHQQPVKLGSNPKNNKAGPNEKSSLVFRFSNPDFAAQFRDKNRGVVVK